MDLQPSLPERPHSYWIASAPTPIFPPLTEPLDIEIAVIGGGIVGVLTAWLLKGSGARVALIEADRVCGGVTGHTTAKVTALHGLIYDYLIGYFGLEKARLYAEANTTALERLAAWVRDGLIACDFRREAACTYTNAGNRIYKIEAEVEALQRLGLPAQFVDGRDIPLPAKAGVRLPNQAHYHPLKFLLEIAPKIPGDGCHVFDRTRALSIRTASRPEQMHEIVTDRGLVRARHVVVATHFPILDKPGLYFSRLYRVRSYVIGMQMDPTPEPAAPTIPTGMYYQYERPFHSYRTQPSEGGTLVLVGGEDHRTGQVPEGDEPRRYERLAGFARQQFGDRPISYRWSTQDNATPDRLPYIGKLAGGERLWTATGFDGWGMTHGVVSALLLADLIAGRDNPWAALYDPARFRPAVSARKFVKENLGVAKHLVGDRLDKPPELTAAQIEKGHGKLIAAPGGGRAAAYKDEEGVLHALEPACTHMGCLVHWNAAEKSWDCPCHGSRFGIDGRVLDAPAVRPLPPRTLTGE